MGNICPTEHVQENTEKKRQHEPTNIGPFQEDVDLINMRDQLKNDADKFLLNNILLSVQFFDNYQRQIKYINDNPICQQEHDINEAMVRYNKHVFFADRLLESVSEHVGYQNTPESPVETLTPSRQYIIYDNIEASDPGDNSDYSAVLDAPFYKLLIEDWKNPGYLALRKLKVLESTLHKDNDSMDADSTDSSDQESTDSGDGVGLSKGEHFLDRLKNKINTTEPQNTFISNVKINTEVVENIGRRYSGPIKSFNRQVIQNSISKVKDIKKRKGISLEEEADGKELDNDTIKNRKVDTSEKNIEKSRKSINRSPRRLSGPIKYFKRNQADTSSTLASTIESTEMFNYKINQNDIYKTESDYEYATITESTTPKRVELSMMSHSSISSGALPDEIWNEVKVQTVDYINEDNDENTKQLYDIHYYLSSYGLMMHFVDELITKLGLALNLSSKTVKNSMTQGPSVYCDAIRYNKKSGIEIFPAIIATWPKPANAWLTRERKITWNPKTHRGLQWPKKRMIEKVKTFGCLLVPVGYRPKRGTNDDQNIQWKIVFPAAERYLENRLAHAPMRCYLFALLLHKTFMENERSKIGIDASHLKNHLFWLCEDDYAKWPDHRLGEVLQHFLSTLYNQMGKRHYPNYFISRCNDFETIPKPILYKQQDILGKIYEAPVMHVLYALDKLKYTSDNFYPMLDVNELYKILTTKNVLQLINPRIPVSFPVRSNGITRSEEKNKSDDSLKGEDKNYKWQKEKQRQTQTLAERRRAIFNNKKASFNVKQKINPNTILPKQLNVERRRPVLDFFISHFIKMADSSQKFDAFRQAAIYLEQAQRLGELLKDEQSVSKELDEKLQQDLQEISNKLGECHGKIAAQDSYVKSTRRVSKAVPVSPVPRTPPRTKQFYVQDSPTDQTGISAFTFVDVHAEHSSQDIISFNELDESGEDSKL